MSTFISFTLHGKVISEADFNAAALAATSYAKSIEIIGKGLALQLVARGNADTTNAFFANAAFKKADGSMSVRGAKIQRYVESLVYGYARVGRDGAFKIVATSKEARKEQRGFYRIGSDADSKPDYHCALDSGRIDEAGAADAIGDFHSFQEFEDYQPVREKLSTEVSALSEAAALRKYRSAHKALYGMTLENISPEAYAEMVKICDELLGVVVSSQGKPNLGIDVDDVTINGNTAKNVVNTSPRSRVALEAEVKNLSYKVRILEAMDSEAMRSQRDAAQVQAERLSKEVELKNEVMRWQSEVISLMREGKPVTAALAMLQACEDDMREAIGDSAIPPKVVSLATENVAEQADDELPEVAALRMSLSGTSDRAEQAKIEKTILDAGLPLISLPRSRVLVKAARESHGFADVLAEYMAAHEAAKGESPLDATITAPAATVECQTASVQ